jgi:23S rRNA A2030 N6-methylase RlmJ
MMLSRNVGVFVVSAFLLAGCGSSLWPSLTGESPAANAPSRERIAIPASPAERAEAAQTQNVPGNVPGSASGSAPRTVQAAAGPAGAQGVPVGQPTGTFVGKKVEAMSQDLGKLDAAVGRLDTRLAEVRGDTADATQRYLTILATMNSKLQVGTTPGNPLLVQQWNEAQQQLKRIEANISKMNNLSNDLGAEASVAGYLLDSVRATFTLSGAVDEDHVQLRQLEDKVNREVVQIDRLLNELSDDLNRQTSHLASEQRNLTAMSISIKNGERYGSSLMNRALAQAEVKASMAARRPLLPDSRPLVVIRFDRPNVQFEQALYDAVSRALDRKPETAFDLVAVHPKAGSTAQVILNSTAARRNAENVLRTLVDMGLPATRINMTSVGSPIAQSNEVRVYVR